MYGPEQEIGEIKRFVERHRRRAGVRPESEDRGGRDFGEIGQFVFGDLAHSPDDLQGPWTQLKDASWRQKVLAFVRAHARARRSA